MTQIIPTTVLCYLLLLVGLWARHVLTPRRSGPLALAQVFAPYLFLPALAVLPFALYLAGSNLRLVLLACTLGYSMRFAPARLTRSSAGMSSEDRLRVMTWNVLRRNRHPDEIVRVLKTAGAEVMALQELVPQHVDAIERDRTIVDRYPHRLLLGRRDSSGIGLLSVYPMLESGTLDTPATLWARLDLGGSRTITLINAHPVLIDPQIQSFDAGHRDNGIAQVRKLVDPMLERGERLLLAGDFNVTQREPAYIELTAGLQDAHRCTRYGPGNTWRSERFLDLRFGLLRLDYLLASPGLTPLDTSVDCARHGSDHCSLHGTFRLVP